MLHTSFRFVRSLIHRTPVALGVVHTIYVALINGSSHILRPVTRKLQCGEFLSKVAACTRLGCITVSVGTDEVCDAAVASKRCRWRVARQLLAPAAGGWTMSSCTSRLMSARLTGSRVFLDKCYLMKWCQAYRRS